MKYFSRRILILSMLLWLAGCGAGSGSAERAQQPGSQWTIALSISGGLAGVRQRAILQNNGEFIAEDQKRHIQVSAQLSDDELQAITAMLARIETEDSTGMPRKSNNLCADCMNYVLSIERQGKQIQWQADSMSLDDSAYSGLVKKLVKLMRRTLAGK